MKYYILLFFALSVLMSCSKDYDESIQDYLSSHNLEAQKHTSGIYYIIDKEGSEEHPTTSNIVTMEYKGYYLDDTQFDSSYDRGEPLVQPLNRLIRGWQIGVPLFGKGGKGKLIIPPNFGYGSNPANGIRADAVLVFDIELIDFK